MARSTQEKNFITKLAEIISIMLSPVVMIIFMVFGVVYRFNLNLLAFVGVLSPFFILTLGYLVYKIYIKRDADVDLTKLRMRRHLWVSTSLGYALSFILSHFYYPDLDSMFLRAGIIVFLSGIISTKWKISFHAIGYASFVLTFVKIFGSSWYLCFILLPVVFAIRLILKKHTLAQLIAGTLLSFVIVI